jgi:hypothetical protein
MTPVMRMTPMWTNLGADFRTAIHPPKGSHWAPLIWQMSKKIEGLYYDWVSIFNCNKARVWAQSLGAKYLLRSFPELLVIICE